MATFKKTVLLTDGKILSFDTPVELETFFFENVHLLIPLLQNCQIHPEEIPESLLAVKDVSGISVFDVCLQRLQEPVKEIRTQVSSSGNYALVLVNQKEKIQTGYASRAWYLAKNRKLQKAFLKNFTILRLADKNGFSVAHHAAQHGRLSTKVMVPEILCLVDNNGFAVAHALAQQGDLPESALTTEILSLSTIQKQTLYHFLARGRIFPKRFMTKEILCLADISGWSVAHELARKKALPEEYIDEEIICLKTSTPNNPGFAKHWYVAHVLAETDCLPKKFRTETYFKLSDSDGLTVAHVSAFSGTLHKSDITPQILLLKTKRGKFVLDVLIENRNLFPELLSLPWDKKTSSIFDYLTKNENYKIQTFDEATQNYLYQIITAFLRQEELKKFQHIEIENVYAIER